MSAEAVPPAARDLLTGFDPRVAAMSVADEKLFRRVMGHFGTGVTVITTVADGAVFGMTANAFMAGSLDPPLCVVSIGRRAKMHARLKAAARFGVSFLGEDQARVSQHFSGVRTLDLPPSFRYLADVPVLTDSLGVVVADVMETVECGDHTLCIGWIVAMDSRGGRPLLFYAGRYAGLEREARLEDLAPGSFW